VKRKLAKAKEGRDKDAVLHKIRLLSPFWTETAVAAK